MSVYVYLFLSHRNVKYTINGHHRDHITVYADVVPVALELSTEVLELTPTPGMPAEAGRLIITVFIAWWYHKQRETPFT